MRQRIDEIADEFGARAPNFAVFAANGINVPGMVAEHGRDFIGVEPGSVDRAPRLDGLLLEMRFVADANMGANGAAGRIQRGDARVRDEIGTAFGRQAGKGAYKILGGKNARGRDFERGGPADVRLARANFGGGNDPETFDAIFLSALLQRE